MAGDRRVSPCSASGVSIGRGRDALQLHTSLKKAGREALVTSLPRSRSGLARIRTGSMVSVPFLPLLLLLAVQTTPAAGGDAAREARALLERGEVEQAIQVLQDGLAKDPGDAALERALAQALERTADEGGSWLAMSDARDAWDRAHALEPDEPEAERGRIAVRLRLGEYEDALALAERALGSAWLSGGSAPPALLELACRARLGTLPPPDSEARPAALAGAWAALRHARELAGGSTGLVLLASTLLDAEGLPARAADELVRAIERAPAASDLHRALIDLYVREGIEERLAPLYERWSGAGTNATLAWFTGYSWSLGGDLAQRERRFTDALEAYRRAGQWMGVAATLEPAFAATADAVRFTTQVSSGWCEIDSGTLDAASERLLGLLRSDLARRDEPDGLGRTLMHALAALGERRIEANDFEHAVAEARAVVARVPELGAWWNNLGFLLREYATQLEAGKVQDGGAREQRARETFRESWQAYRRAVELAPDDVRVLNDAALVQVYHLRDNLGEAEALLERAIENGEAQLAALGSGADERARFPLAQALGDAYLNLGYLCYHVYRQPGRARSAFERALATDSGDRSYLADYLAAIAGERGPVAEPDRGAMVAAPRTAPRERAVIPWEASLAEARERARSEGRALLVYQRGDALGLSVGELDELVTSSAFARATQGVVLLVSDAERRTFVERRHDGRRVCCPRFGTITCGEHLRVHEEVGAWLEELLGAPPGESEEGLWLLQAGSTQPERLIDLARLSELPAPPALHAGPFEALEASLGGEDGGGEARELVGTRSLEARLACERILWEGFRSSPARGFLLTALAEDPGESARELLAASVSQCVDTELELGALAVWPRGVALAPVQHAWRWSPAAEARSAAEKVLLRERPDDPVWKARAVLD